MMNRFSMGHAARAVEFFGALVASFLLVVALGAPAYAFELPPEVSGALKEAGIPLRSVSVVVQSVDRQPPLIRHNARQSMNSASAMKLVTTYAALELLGPAYTWRTEAFGDAAGNLYLRGSGDPRLALEQFWLLLRQLRTRGVGTITGDLILDRGAFQVPPHDPGEFDHEPYRPYNVGPDALLVNLNSVRLSLRSEASSRVVAVVAETPEEDLPLNNRLRLSDEACGDWREKFKVAVVDGVIELSGVFPLACGEKVLNLSPWAADVQLERLFRSLWRELGGSLAGKVRAGSVPASARLLVSQESPALGEIVREINKYSNNVMARQVFLSLDLARPATPEGARRRVAAWLAEKGVGMPDLVLDNGSGLSRKERISADGLSQLLLAAWESPVMPELISSLPLAGVDGTLKKRLNGSAATGRAHLKTGYLDGVRAIAGYVLDNKQRRWVVVFLINDPHSRLGKPAMDALLRWVAER